MPVSNLFFHTSLPLAKYSGVPLLQRAQVSSKFLQSESSTLIISLHPWKGSVGNRNFFNDQYANVFIYPIRLSYPTFSLNVWPNQLLFFLHSLPHWNVLICVVIKFPTFKISNLNCKWSIPSSGAQTLTVCINSYFFLRGKLNLPQTMHQNEWL